MAEKDYVDYLEKFFLGHLGKGMVGREVEGRLVYAPSWKTAKATVRIDLVLCVNGKFIGIEAKDPEKHQDPSVWNHAFSQAMDYMNFYQFHTHRGVPIQLEMVAIAPFKSQSGFRASIEAQNRLGTWDGRTLKYGQVPIISFVNGNMRLSLDCLTFGKKMGSR